MSTNRVGQGDLDWRVTRLCESGACVGVALQGESVLIANTSDPEAPVSRFTKQEWTSFIAGIKLGEFDDLT
ncbi:MAG TPA: DUF397 domain-containing protein [Streptosporangiaceae bacterium]|jgi:predicted secreted Zn-dependent protease